MDIYNVLYIDDRPDSLLSKYLDSECNIDGVQINYDEIIFVPAYGYESLLNNQKVRDANVIFIDSRLFENQTASDGKFSGEEFKFVLKKFYPYIETIVITQNDIGGDILSIPKFNSGKGGTAIEYYGNCIPNALITAFSNIKQYRILAERLNENASWEKLLKEKVIATLEGSDEYDQLSKEDIDTLIDSFKELQEKLDG